jgi:hypothetical protein
MKKQRVYETTNHLGQECVVQVQHGSANSKTGDSVQVWVLPKSWVFEGEKAMIDDEASCMDCPHSKRANRSCYVRKGFAEYGLKSKVKSLNSGHKSGKLEIRPIDELVQYEGDKVKGKFIRFGAYGEPVLLGENTVKLLVSLASNWTGYTHQWHLDNYSWANKYFMASVETEALKNKANSRGFRTFRVRSKKDEITKQEVVCPASKEAGRITTCNNCALCKGASSKAKDILIFKH